MAKLKPFNIRFKASASPDVVDNRFYYKEVPDPVDYDSIFVSLGNTKDAEDYVHADLAALLPSIDGVYNIGIAAVDDGGNEADMSTLNDVPLDFVAPDSVGSIEIL